ncbi:hypothetical protein J1605_016434 [Eschrichtius robustus]|uniref:Uncharacterized protein n=1 Tax=Eschrichtius robustus TaxID=9764 RepID=A0AB34I3W6_ESCRO|nr:hypothetical protein J1605_016434 [Eschrichtius robustus]
MMASPHGHRDGHRARTGHPDSSFCFTLTGVITPGWAQLPEASCSWGKAGQRGSQAETSWRWRLQHSVRRRAQALPSQDSPETSLVIRWLRLYPSNAGGVGSTPGRETKIPHAPRCSAPPKKKMAQKLKLLPHPTPPPFSVCTEIARGRHSSKIPGLLRLPDG